jgi:hypothetical protein
MCDRQVASRKSCRALVSGPVDENGDFGLGFGTRGP